MSGRDGNGGGRQDFLAGVAEEVDFILQDFDQRDERRHMTQEERGEEQRKKARAEKDAARQRVHYDLPAALRDAVKAVAEEEGITASNVAALLLAEGVARWRERRLVIANLGLKRTSDSPKWDYTVTSETILAVLAGRLPLER